MQQTNFAFEVLIHDDASTDGTTEIIKEYEAKYPDIIKPIYEDENQWVKGRRGSAVFNFPRAKGKYIALCEGDDYWTDPLKLQKQVDFLEKSLDYSMCSTRCLFYYEEGKQYKETYPQYIGDDNIVTLDKLVRGYNMPQTLTLVFRKSLLGNSLYKTCTTHSDIVLYYSLLKLGSGFCIQESTGVYRIHNHGIWSSLDSLKGFIWETQMKIAIVHADLQSTPAIHYLLYQFTKSFPRKALLVDMRLFFECFKLLSKALGWWRVIYIYVNKFLFNRNLSITSHIFNITEK